MAGSQCWGESQTAPPEIPTELLTDGERPAVWKDPFHHIEVETYDEGSVYVTQQGVA